MATFKSHRSAAERVFDHLYDPIYATSGHRDVQRNNYRSMAASARIGVYPVFQTMFTDLPWRRRNLYVPQSNMLPNIDRMANSSVPECPIVQCTYAKPAVLVCGADRAKFFDKPITNTNTIALRLNLLDIDCCCIPVPVSSVRPHAVGCQSEYRIQSAQTYPWMPDAVIRNANGTQEPPETPEIVYVADLLREDRISCMPGVYEAELVTRARKRRAWERSLPPIATQEDFERRRAVLEAFEWESWIGRENRIEYCQRLRLGIVQRLMQERQTKQSSDCMARAETSKQRLEAERDKKLLKLRSEHRRRQRRLDAVHNGVQMKWRPSDVITEHIDPSSVLYAPPMRFGKHPRQRHFEPSSTLYVATMDAVNLQEDKVIKLPAKSSRKTANEELKELYVILQSLRGRRADNVQPNCLKNIEQITSCTFETPKDSDNPRLNDHEHQHAIFMQKLLKGRAVQKQLYNGRNKHRELIAEFKSSHQLSEIVQMNRTQHQLNRTTENRKQAHQRQMQLAALLRAESQVQEVAEQAVSTTISFALDLLESEMVRIIDQKKAHALCMLAENERYRREAAEAGRRQCSENRRRFHDEVTRSIDTARQNTVCKYLENVLVECLDKMSERQARSEIRATVRLIDREANNECADSLVAEVLERDVLPDVFRRIAHENYLADVHRGFFGELVPDKIDEARRKRLQKFIGDAVITPRGAEMSSGRGGLDAVTDDPAHLEALQCIEQVLGRVLKDGGGDTDRSQEGSILDEIISSANLDEVDSVAISSRSAEHERLTEIVTDVNNTLWAYANEAQDAEDRDEHDVVDNEPGVQIQVQEKTNDFVDEVDEEADIALENIEQNQAEKKSYKSEDNNDENADVEPIMDDQNPNESTENIEILNVVPEIIVQTNIEDE